MQVQQDPADLKAPRRYWTLIKSFAATDPRFYKTVPLFTSLKGFQYCRDSSTRSHAIQCREIPQVVEIDLVVGRGR